MESDNNDKQPTESFWDHLEVMRFCIIRIIIAVTISGVLAFLMKEPLFRIILAPCHGDFVTYRFLGTDNFNLHLINTGLAEQMLIHMKVALCVGILAVSPYIIYILYGFISPALYNSERRITLKLTLSAYLMFIIGIVLNYILIFPLTVRFLGLYQVSADIDNMLTVSSYIDTLLMLSLTFGIVFEIPVLSWLLAKAGLLQAQWMTHFRRHAIVAILIIAAVITPTSDVFTLVIVSLPIWILYELSICIVKKTKLAKC